jgi:hypothetical protein
MAAWFSFMPSAGRSSRLLRTNCSRSVAVCHRALEPLHQLGVFGLLLPVKILQLA